MEIIEGPWSSQKWANANYPHGQDPLLSKIVEGIHTITLMPDFDNGKNDFFEEAGFGQTLPTQQGLNERKGVTELRLLPAYSQAKSRNRDPPAPTIFLARTENNEERKGELFLSLTSRSRITERKQKSSPFCWLFAS